LEGGGVLRGIEFDTLVSSVVAAAVGDNPSSAERNVCESRA
jgi:hypothetical protein